MKTISKTLFVAATLLTSHRALAHTTYGGTARDLGTVSGAGITPYFKTIDNQTVTSNFGWVAGTSPSFGDAHDIKAYRFTLAEAGWATITVSTAVRGTGGGTLLPAFSLYSGLLHTNGVSDYDGSAATLAYLATLGDPASFNGAFDALHTWKMGNDAGELSMLGYIGHAADGSFANPAISGDGLADGSVWQTFWLGAGDYSLMIGGADPTATDGTGTYGIDVSLTVVPEPSGIMLISLFALGFLARRKR